MTKFGMRCGCGRDVWADCPDLGEIVAVRDRFVGWGYDAQGRVRCPDCLGGETVPVAPVAGQGGEQLDLLGVAG